MSEAKRQVREPKLQALHHLCASEDANLSVTFDPCPEREREAEMHWPGIIVWFQPWILPSREAMTSIFTVFCTSCLGIEPLTYRFPDRLAILMPLKVCKNLFNLCPFLSLCATVSVWGGHGGLVAAATGSFTAENHKQLLWENQSPVYKEIGAEHQVCPAGRTTGTSSMTCLQTLPWWRGGTKKCRFTHLVQRLWDIRGGIGGGPLKWMFTVTSIC